MPWRKALIARNGTSRGAAMTLEFAVVHIEQHIAATG